jgi:hypothetical protein
MSEELKISKEELQKELRKMEQHFQKCVQYISKEFLNIDVEKNIADKKQTPFPSFELSDNNDKLFDFGDFYSVNGYFGGISIYLRNFNNDFFLELSASSRMDEYFFIIAIVSNSGFKVFDASDEEKLKNLNIVKDLSYNDYKRVFKKNDKYYIK